MDEQLEEVEEGVVLELTEDQFEQWLKDLRSGKYKQGRLVEFDKVSGSYCAMGVLGSLLYGHDGPVWDYENETAWIHIPKILRSRGFHWEVNGEKTDNEETLYSMVSSLNDGGRYGHSWNFERIADFLEANRALILGF